MPLCPSHRYYQRDKLFKHLINISEKTRPVDRYILRKKKMFCFQSYIIVVLDQTTTSHKILY